MKKININKILVFLVLLTLQSFAQKKDAYFLLDKNNPNFTFSASNGKLTKETLLSDFSIIYLLPKKEYETYRNDLQKFEQKLKDLGRNPTREEFNQRPRLGSWDFEVISRKKVTINHRDLDKLNIVNFEWLKRNSWIENNPNILFKDLYFLFKIEKDKYISYKVGRTLVEY